MASKPSDDELPSVGPRDNRKPDAAPAVPAHELLRCIGSGSYGEVWLARNVMGTYRAVKIVYRQTFANDKPYDREFSGIKKFEPVSRTHGGLVDVLQVGRDDAAGYFYHVMELCDDEVSGQQIDPGSYVARTLGRELSNRGRLPFDECLQLGLNLAAALGHLHKNGLIHRDIKPSNIIFVNGIPKIADIGLVADAGAARSFVGTEGFIPPEGPGTVQADIYSLGKVLYEISTGHDRQTFPELPTRLDEFTNQKEYLELNEVILRACESDLPKRYRSADAMHADLLLLGAGKSVKRLRLLEHRIALVKRVAVAAAVSIAVAAGVLYAVNREIKFAAERRQQQVGQTVARGTRSMDRGDLFESLFSFASALSLNQGDPQREEPDRIRIASVLQLCPKVVCMIVEESVVYSADLSPNGQRIVTACASGANVWNAVNGEKLFSLLGSVGEVETACFSPDGRFILTAGSDKAAHLWDGRTGRELRVMPQHDHVMCARFNPDGRLIVTGCTDGTVGVWDWATKTLVVDLPKQSKGVRDVSFSPDGLQILTAGEDGKTLVWDWRVQKPVRILTNPPLPQYVDNWVQAASFSPDGRYVVTGSFDRVARVWDIRAGLQIRHWTHDGPIHSAEFDPEGRYVVIGGWEDHSAQIWNFDTNEEVTPSLRHGGNVDRASFSQDGRYIITACEDQTVRLWDLSPRQWSAPKLPFDFSGDGNCFVAISNEVVRVGEPGASGRAYPPIMTGTAVSAAKLSRDGSRVITIAGRIDPSGPATRVARVWNTLNGQPLAGPFSYHHELTNTVFSDAGSYLLVFGGNTAELWATETGALIARLPHDGEVEEASFSTSGGLIVTTSGNEATLWEASTGHKLKSLVHSSKISHAEFSADGRFLVTSGSVAPGVLTPCNAQVWEVKTGKPVGPQLGHRDDVLYASFNSTGQRVVTASEDRYAKVWQVPMGKPLTVIPHKDHVIHAEFSPNGRWVVTACSDGTARVWDAETGEPLTAPIYHKNIREAKFTATGRSMLTKTPEESRIWELRPHEGSVEELELLTRVLSGHEVVQSTGVPIAEAETLRRSWRQMQTRFPQDFSVSPDAAVSWREREAEVNEEWHRVEAERCEVDRQWFAATVHLGRLIAIHPEDPILHDRLTHAKDLLGKSGALNDP